MVDRALPPPRATKDGWFRNSIIADELSRRGLMELIVSHTWDGDDAYAVWGTIVEPVELKTNVDPIRTGKKSHKIDFHKGSVHHHEQVASSKVIVGVFMSDGPLERLSEVWMIDTDSAWHDDVRRKIVKMRLTGKRSSSLSLSYSRLPRVARRLI